MDIPLPFFTLIIPTYNRPETLQRCLTSLTYLTYPSTRFEVIVVDDGSPSSLEPVVRPFYDRLPLRLMTQPNSGPAAARNTGAAQASGTFLAFTDDDCTPDADWLQALASYFATRPGHLIGGQTVNALPSNPYARASQHLSDYLYGYYKTGGVHTRFFTSNNLAMATERFHAVGGFDPTFPHAAGEDREFCDRWLHQGWPMTYAPEAVVRHAHAMTMGSFLRQHFYYGRGAHAFHKARTQRTRTHLRTEPPSFYINMLRYPFQQQRIVGAVGSVFLLIFSQLANILGFLWELLRPGKK